MITSILSVITWIVQNPDIIAKGEQYVVGVVSDAIAAWNRFQSGELTTDQLQAEWTAAGVDYAAISVEADRRGM